MVKPLTFKGDKKPKKRKRQDNSDDGPRNSNQELVASSSTAAEASSTAEDQHWVSADIPGDLTGPVIIVLPSTPPTCLASDAHGKVFASEVENLIEGNPSTAEPHDVRQVWVATKIAGTDGVNFKGHHGRYLSCDKHGLLSATASAVSALESFVIVPSPGSPGLFSFQICAGDVEAYLTIKESTGKTGSSAVEIRGDADSISFATSFRVRMQARFKPKLKAFKESKALEKISRKELEAMVGRRLEDDEVKRLKRARREGTFHEEFLDVRVKGKHDKFG